ncbi:helix-turn-helix domain-containing protein [Micromonospora sp. ATCC 39149]|uniref:Helix-turn-helix transcriptional regulator n=1 Tax=Micromonospora carbonacea TaxID=47853 RepID=A0A7D6CD75_9ACTN|nr:helix-turn-helix transcriptional regulator [Micromonospora sp. ATCC 39149]QLJ99163.1 helix-turn-helix transcriptional regulator [Micromonospora carbonacea]
MSLLRRVIGGVLRRVRQRQGRTLREVAEAAGVSLPYLSEVERGRKEASSEVLAAICRALGIGLSDLLEEARDDLRRVERRLPAAPRAALARLDPVVPVGGETSPRPRLGFHADASAPQSGGTPRVQCPAPVSAGRVLRLGGVTPSAGGRLLHVGGAGFGAPVASVGGAVGHLGSAGHVWPIRLFASAPLRRPAARTARVLARRRARAGRRRLTVR